MKTNRNELIRRLLSGITNDELQNLVRVREEARRPIPTPRKRIPTPAPRKMGVKQLIRYFEMIIYTNHQDQLQLLEQRNSNQKQHRGQKLVKNRGRSKVSPNHMRSV